MNNALRILLCIIAGISGLAATAQYLAVVPPGTIPQEWINHAIAASLILLAVKEGIVAIGDILDDGVRNNSFNIDKLKDRVPLIVCGWLCLLVLPACTSADRDAVLTEAKASGARVLKAGAKAAEDAALQEVRGYVNRTAAKQPVHVTP